MTALETAQNWQAHPAIAEGELKKLYPRRIPKHVAFIPDGNRRWAKKHRIFPEEGHKIGADSLLEIIKTGLQIGIKILSFFIFSTENWLRPQREINAQMKLLEKSLILQRPHMVENGVRFRSIGDLSKFPPHLIALIEETEAQTAHLDKINVVFAMNYGGRDDIKRAFVKLLTDYEDHRFTKEDISEALISRHLDTCDWDDPDLLIRTSGESRVSNFLLWQLSYAEIYLTHKHWPEFTPQDFLHAVIEFQNRERRLGGS